MADEYQAACVYDLEGEFLGYTIHKINTLKVWGTNLYRETTDEQPGEEEELKANLARLNQGAEMSAHWPDRDDPELLALIDDPQFEPIEYHEEEVIDDIELQAMLDAGKIEPPQIDPVSGNTYWADYDALPKTVAKVPVDPSASQVRFRKAAETIALKRMASGNS